MRGGDSVVPVDPKTLLLYFEHRPENFNVRKVVDPTEVLSSYLQAALSIYKVRKAVERLLQC